MSKVLCVLYDDPVDGYPTSYARDAIPAIERYHNGQMTPTRAGAHAYSVGGAAGSSDKAARLNG